MLDEQSRSFVVQLFGIDMRYGRGPRALCGVNLSLSEGSFQFLCGPSGSGKSSLLRLLYLAHRPSRGVISLFGRRLDLMSPDEFPDLRRQIGVVFQDFRLIDSLTVYENVELSLRVRRGNTSKMRHQVRELLQWVGLGDCLDVRPPYLSGGQQQRVAIARAVVVRPRLLLADEPTGNVDDAVATRILYLFEELHRQGTAVVFATHNTKLLSKLRKPVIELEEGSIRRVSGGSQWGAPLVDTAAHLSMMEH